MPNGMIEAFSLHVPWHSMRCAGVAEGHYADGNGHLAFREAGTGVAGRRAQACFSTYEIGESPMLVL